MKATIYHNPRCSTSRRTLELLQAEGAEVAVIDYLAAPLSRDDLARLYAAAGLSPREGLRAREPLATDLDLAHVGDDALLDAMAANPILIERPLVETSRGVRLCRPPERVREIL